MVMHLHVLAAWLVLTGMEIASGLDPTCMAACSPIEDGKYCTAVRIVHSQQ
jgi:hypothetical protein